MNGHFLIANYVYPVESSSLLLSTGIMGNLANNQGEVRPAQFNILYQPVLSHAEGLKAYTMCM